jgi:hypothetical protein
MDSVRRQLWNSFGIFPYVKGPGAKNVVPKFLNLLSMLSYFICATPILFQTTASYTLKIIIGFSQKFSQKLPKNQLRDHTCSVSDQRRLNRLIRNRIGQRGNRVRIVCLETGQKLDSYVKTEKIEVSLDREFRIE